MNELDKLLQSARPHEPSSDYLDRGLAQIAAAAAPANRVARGWRYAAIGFALLFVVSLLLNVLYWTGERQQTVAEAAFVHSVLRREGDLLIRETRYESPSRPAETSEKEN